MKRNLVKEEIDHRYLSSVPFCYNACSNMLNRIKKGINSRDYLIDSYDQCINSVKTVRAVDDEDI